MQIKHAVTALADMSSSGGCEMRWMSQDEGSDRRSRSLVHSSVMGVEDARMTSVKRERSGGVKISQQLMNALFSKTFQIYECSPLDASVEVKKGGYIQVNLIMSLNTFLSVAPLLSPSGTLSPFRISIVSVSTTFHALAQKWWNHRVGPSFLMHRRDSCACYK